MILSLDLGFNRLGWSLSKNTPLHYGCFETSSKLKFEDRLLLIFEFLDNLIRTKNVTVIIAENPVGLKNLNGFKLIQVLGLVSLLSAMYKTEILLFSPTEMKKIVTGLGNADKEDIAILIEIQTGAY